MSDIAAGIFISAAAAATATWATFGDRLRLIPGVARVVDYLDGGFNLPSEAEVDELVRRAERRRTSGAPDGDDLVPGTNVTYGEDFASRYARPAVSEEAIRDASEDRELAPLDDPHPATLLGRARAWLKGGYAMPTGREVDAHGPHTLRGRSRRLHIPRGFVFADEPASVVLLPNPTGLVEGT